MLIDDRHGMAWGFGCWTPSIETLFSAFYVYRYIARCMPALANMPRTYRAK